MKEPKIEVIGKKKFLGLNVKMSLVENKTQALWQSFGPRIKEVQNRVEYPPISLQVYHPDHFLQFNPNRAFDKWALVEVENFNNIPDGLSPFELVGGQYAIFNYKGSSKEASDFFRYIYTEWVPQSSYSLDERPHFEVLGDKYRNNDPASEEEIWIPIKSTK